MNPAASSSSSATTPRIVSLDQFRGLTVLGMFFVNFMGQFLVISPLFKHHNTYCSLADLIMPQFFFAVGLAYRLTYQHGVEKNGRWPTIARILRRNLGLILLGVVVYVEGNAKPWTEFMRGGFSGVLNKELLRQVFQTLVHIGLTAIWILPVMGARPWVRIGYGLLSAGLHLLLSWNFYFIWVNTPPKGIDGGYLGFLSWSVPMLAGSVAYDGLLGRPNQAFTRFVLAGAFLMSLGYSLSCIILPPQMAFLNGNGLGLRLAESPFVSPIQETSKGDPITVLQMSQRTGAISYMGFATGFSLALYGLFVLVCDQRKGWNSNFLRTLGNNALAAYLIHDIVGRAISPFAPRDAPLWYVLMVFGIYLGIITLFLRYLEKRQLFLRL